MNQVLDENEEIPNFHARHFSHDNFRELFHSNEKRELNEKLKQNEEEIKKLNEEKNNYLSNYEFKQQQLKIEIEKQIHKMNDMTLQINNKDHKIQLLEKTNEQIEKDKYILIEQMKENEQNIKNKEIYYNEIMNINLKEKNQSKINEEIKQQQYQTQIEKQKQEINDIKLQLNNKELKIITLEKMYRRK